MTVYWLVIPLVLALIATHSPRAAVEPADLGRPYEPVLLETSDGLRLAGWYVPSENGAAILAYPGRSGPVPHARMLAAHGYGVLLLDMRGRGESEGDPAAFGWGATRDVAAGVAYLRTRPDVEVGRIGGLGLSVGGEQLLEAAAEGVGLGAVVSDGAGTRSIREHLTRGPAGWPSLPTAAVLAAATAVLSWDLPPPSLEQLVGRISPVPILLVYAGNGQGGEDLNRTYFGAAGEPKTLWEIPEAGHRAGSRRGRRSTRNASCASSTRRFSTDVLAAENPKREAARPPMAPGSVPGRLCAMTGGNARPQSPLVEARDIHKIYDTGKVKVHALNGVSLSVARGEMVAIMGPSGCGKTTLLNCLSGLDAVDAGDVLIEGTSLASMSDRERTDYRALHMGFVFQFYNLMPVLSAVENVELPLLIARRSQKEARERALEALGLVDLAGRAHHLPDELSGGERQRVTIARALVNDPAIVWADEPTGDLDSERAAEIVDLMRSLNEERGLTFLLVTHDLSVGQKTDRIVRMLDGEVATIAQPELVAG